MEVKLDKLARVIAGCWAEAEIKLTELISEKHPNPPEELITDLLAGELRASIAQASRAHRVENAFLEDLESQIPNLNVSDARRFGGLVAAVTPHTKPHESQVSAADLGIVILRPQVWLNGWGNETIECSRDHATGLLAQAKLGQHRKRCEGYIWNSLKKKPRGSVPKASGLLFLTVVPPERRGVERVSTAALAVMSRSHGRRRKAVVQVGSFPGRATVVCAFEKPVRREDRYSGCEYHSIRNRPK